MIIGIVGMPGSGKSYYAVQSILHDRNFRGRTVFSNIPMVSAHRFEPDDFLSFALPRRSVVLLDEVQRMAPARAGLGDRTLWASIPYEVYVYFAEGRKYQLDFVWTAQDGSRVDKTLREVTQEWVEVTWIFGQRFPLRRVDSYASMASQVMGIRSKSRRFFWLKKSGFAVYDSFYTALGRPPRDSEGQSWPLWSKADWSNYVPESEKR
jgi:hypothetical protein